VTVLKQSAVAGHDTYYGKSSCLPSTVASPATGPSSKPLAVRLARDSAQDWDGVRRLVARLKAYPSVCRVGTVRRWLHPMSRMVDMGHPGLKACSLFVARVLSYPASELHAIGCERLQIETSRRGEVPNMRVYSRLNCETLA